MKEKRTVYIVEKEDCEVFKVFDTLAEAKAYMLHEYLKWFDTDTVLDHNELDWFVNDIRSIDEQAYVEELFYLHEAEYGGE
jgi:hypothetical protein|uniref:Uncharacterized protein n=1 Tax=Siphoviridae sp. ct2vX3 TaxID=2825318 RepID=A0A8S5PX66_9CAUD|nr:MAG TPA: hypothetical protein [Siphoviridae sp. ct2vX3]